MTMMFSGKSVATVIDGKGRTLASLDDLDTPLKHAISGRTARLASIQLEQITGGSADPASLADEARDLRIGIAVLSAILRKREAGETHYPVTELFLRNIGTLPPCTPDCRTATQPR